LESAVVEWIGWTATLVVVASYFSGHAGRLRVLQMLGAVLWTSYGLVIDASPVIAANVLVFGAAAITLPRSSGSRQV
jgi:hypothetical protein